MDENITTDRIGVVKNRTWTNDLPDGDTDAVEQLSRESEIIGINVQSLKNTQWHGDILNVGLIDVYRLTQESLAKALGDLHPEISIAGFTTIKDCVAGARNDYDLIIYYLHGSEVSDTTITQTITTLCQAFPISPVIIFSDADRTQQPKIMRCVLKSGARGFVPTQTADLPITLAAIRFVKAGGTFVPVDLLLTARPEGAIARQNRLTTRQSAVLGHLQRGTSNKIIAYELGMSESTVKVHVRNIMRKMGATNRTQAAYKAQRLSNEFENGKPMEI